MIHPFKVLEERAKSSPNENAFYFLRLGNKRFDSFQPMTWLEVFDRVKKYGTFLKTLQLNPGDRIGLWSKNSAEWLIADWAIMCSGFVSVPLYPQSPQSEIRLIAEEADLKIILVDEKDENISTTQISLSDIEELDIDDSEFFVPHDLDPDSLATIIYTSGTCGVPKGVMHSMRNGYEAIQSAIKAVNFRRSDQLFSYLPLSHVAERILVQWGSLYSGASVFILDRIERLPQFLPMARPTIFLAVPRVWETLLAKIERELDSKPWIQKIPNFLKPFIIGRIVKKKIGLDRCRLSVSGAAKLSSDIANRFSKLGIKISEAYGLTETMGVSLFEGRAFPNVQVMLGSDGEVCLKAAFHFLGYYKNEKATSEVLKSGWFHTGDIAVVAPDGKYYLTDRKKNIFKSSNGKYVAPWPIEIRLKKYPAIKEAMVIGENKPYCIAFASVDESFNEEADLQAFLEKINAELAPHEQIKTLGFVKGAWSIDSGELTTTFKLKRRVILEKYQPQIDELYETRSRVRYFQ